MTYGPSEEDRREDVDQRRNCAPEGVGKEGSGEEEHGGQEGVFGQGGEEGSRPEVVGQGFRCQAEPHL